MGPIAGGSFFPGAGRVRAPGVTLSFSVRVLFFGYIGGCLMDDGLIELRDYAVFWRRNMGECVLAGHGSEMIPVKNAQPFQLLAPCRDMGAWLSSFPVGGVD
jgi:hypothetical protein